jgi:hypothetical protein
LLATDQTLPDKYRDHALTGEYTKHRECSLKPDLLLIYKNRTIRRCDWYVSAPTANSSRGSQQDQSIYENRAGQLG